MNVGSFELLAYIFIISALGIPGFCIIIDYMVEYFKNIIKGYDFESEHKESEDFRKDK